MNEKQGTAIIYVLGIADSFPFALVGADVEILKVADADGPSAGRGARGPVPRGECVATGETDSDGRYSTPLPVGTYRAEARFAKEFAKEKASSDPFHICGDDRIDVTVQVPLRWL